MSQTRLVSHSFSLWSVTAVLILLFEAPPAAAEDVELVEVVNERNDGIESKIWTYNTVTREKSKSPLFTKKNGVYDDRKIKCKKNEVIYAEPVHDVYALDNRQQQCRADVRIVLRLSSIASLLFIEGDRLVAVQKYGEAIAAYTEASQRAGLLYPQLALEAQRRALLALGNQLGVSDAARAEVDGGYVLSPLAKQALLTYQSKHYLDTSGELDEATLARLAGSAQQQAITVAYQSAVPLEMYRAGNYQVFFDAGATDIEKSWADILAKAVNKVEKTESKKVEILGYADPAEIKGSVAAAAIISNQRAQAVRSALIEAGLDPELITVGRGDTLLAADDPSSLNPANRRVQIMVSSQ